MLAIFKRDFKAYFTSPIGFLYLGSYILVLNLYFYLANLNAAYPTNSLGSVFSFMLLVMMFLTPILTMRVFSDEYRQKTDQLMLTSPVKLSGIVIGKFLSSLAMFLCLLVLTLLWPATIAIVGQNNMAEVLGNYLGMICIGAAYISMGVFISSLTENQVIAAVGSLGLFVGLYLLELLTVSLSTTLPGWALAALRFVSIFGRYSDISAGLLALDDFVYFLSISAVFLFLTVRVLEKRRWS
ncbi:MAG: ABC transporter permease subunit [Oscillospiraceae bacterium]|jgi:ABC-2 type transport system permease protein|nr:ABC transporter permease subunit [Oscillospiraceae bacterium]